MNPTLLEWLHRKYDKLIKWFLWRRGPKNHDEVEDLAQETWRKVCIAVYRGDRPDYPYAWLLHIAANVAKDHWRRLYAKRRVHLVSESNFEQGRGEGSANAVNDAHVLDWVHDKAEVAGGADGRFRAHIPRPGEALLVAEEERFRESQQQAVETVLGAMDPSDRDLLLANVDGATVRALAESNGVSRSTMQRRIGRAREELRLRLLENHPNNEEFRQREYRRRWRAEAQTRN